MVKLIPLLSLCLSAPAFAASDCTPVSPSHPASISISAKEGENTISLPRLLAIGNLGAPKQPSETFVIQAGAMSFSITPIASCSSGMQLRVETASGTTEVLAPWTQLHIVSGEAGSEYYISVTANKIDP